MLDPIDSIWEYPQRFISYFSYSISASNNVEQFHTHTHTWKTSIQIETRKAWKWYMTKTFTGIYEKNLLTLTLPQYSHSYDNFLKRKILSCVLQIIKISLNLHKFSSNFSHFGFFDVKNDECICYYHTHKAF